MQLNYHLIILVDMHIHYGLLKKKIINKEDVLNMDNFIDLNILVLVFI